MPIFFPLTEHPIHLSMRVGTQTGVEGIAIKIETVGDFLVPQSIQQKAEAYLQYEFLTPEERAKYLLHLMLMAAEDLDSK